MDETSGHQNLQKLSHQFVTSDFVKKVTPLLLSVSVFSFFLSYSSWYCFFLHSLKVHFSTFSFQLLSHTMDKNYLFLICNGILMFLAKTSGFISFSPSSDHPNDQLFKTIGDGEGLKSLSSSEMIKDSLLEREVSMETTDPWENIAEHKEEEQQEEDDEKYFMEGETEESYFIVDYKERNPRAGLLITTLDEDEDDGKFRIAENEKNGSTVNGIQSKEDEGDDNGLISTEELNKKFEDFIRRIKEEIRVGAQQQLPITSN
ncbi:hypothetical protein U1Q18_000302 [Sarracenia purpurea var. burkii]